MKEGGGIEGASSPPAFPTDPSFIHTPSTLPAKDVWPFGRPALMRRPARDPLPPKSPPVARRRPACAGVCPGPGLCPPFPSGRGEGRTKTDERRRQRKKADQ